MNPNTVHIVGVIPVDNSKLPEKRNWFKKYNVAPICTTACQAEKMLQSLLSLDYYEAPSVVFRKFKLLLSAGCNGDLRTMQQTSDSLLNYTARNGISLLCTALVKGQMTVMAWLLSKGVAINMESHAVNPLLICCCEGWEKPCLELIKAGADVNWQDNKGRTALMAAAQYGQVNIIHILLKYDADINHKSKDGHSALDFAVFYGRWDVCKLFMPQVEAFGAREMMLCAHSGKCDMLEYLYSSGCSLSESDADGSTPLMVACCAGHSSVVKYLLEKHAYLHSKNSSGMTAFLYSCYADDITVTDLLFKTNSAVSLESDNYKNSSLIIASAVGNIALVKELVKQSSLVNKPNVDGITPLMASSVSGHADVVELLINISDVELENKNKLTALCLAHIHKQSTVIEVYRKKGITLCGMQTPSRHKLFMAASGSDKGVFLDLLRSGVKPRFGDSHDVTPLMAASYNGNIDVVQALLQYDTDSFCTNCLGCTALHYAIDGNNIQVVDLLLTQGLDFEDENGIGQTVLHKSVLSGSLELVTRVVRLGMVLDHTDDAGNTALILAVKSGFTDIASFLISLGVATNCQTREGVTALDIAKQSGNAIVQTLLDVSDYKDQTYILKGRKFLEHCRRGNVQDIEKVIVEDSRFVNFCDPNDDLDNPLFISCKTNNLQLLCLLQENGANLNVRRRDGVTTLHYACYVSNIYIVKWLVANGCHINSVRDDGTTPLLITVIKERKETMKCLLQGGALLHKKNLDGVSAVSLCIEKCKCDMLKVFLEYGLEVNCRLLGITPLAMAVIHGNTDVVKLLVDLQADVNDSDKGGTTVLMGAAIRGHFDIIKYLVDHGSDINAVTKNGENVVDIALSHGFPDIAMWLQARLSSPSQDGNVDSSDVCSSDTLGNSVGEVGGGNEAQLLLLECCSKNQSSEVEEIVQQLILNGAELDESNKLGQTPLAVAAYNKNHRMVECLTKAGVDVNSRDNEGLTPIMYACQNNDDRTVEILLKYKPDLLTRDGSGYSAVNHAINCSSEDVLPLITKPWGTEAADVIDNGNICDLKELIEGGISVNHRDSNGQTLLHLCVTKCGNNQQALIDLLCSECANVNMTDHHGLSPLHLGFLTGNIVAIDQLFKHGASLKQNNTEILSYIGNSDNVKVLDLALKYELVNVRSVNDTFLLLQCAAAVGNASGLAMIIDSCTSCADNLVGQLFIQSIKQRQIAICLCALDHGISTNCHDECGRTALTLAAEIGDLNAVKDLLERKADIHWKDGQGMNAMYIALRNSHYDVANMLCKSDLVTVDENHCCVLENKRLQPQQLIGRSNLIDSEPESQERINEQGQWRKALAKAYHIIVTICHCNKPACFQGISRGWKGPVIHFHTDAEHFEEAGKYINELTTSVLLKSCIEECHFQLTLQRDVSYSLVGNSGTYNRVSDQNHRDYAVALVSSQDLTSSGVDENSLSKFDNSRFYSIGCFIRSSQSGSEELWLITCGDWLPPTCQDNAFYKSDIQLAINSLAEQNLIVTSQECLFINDVTSNMSVNLLIGKLSHDSLSRHEIPEVSMDTIFDGRDEDLHTRKVSKTGFASGCTSGVIIDANTTFRDKTGSYYHGSFVVAPERSSEHFACPGDTGSLVADNNKHLGLIIAGQKKYYLPNEGRVYYNVVFCLRLDCATKYLRDVMKFNFSSTK